MTRADRRYPSKLSNVTNLLGAVLDEADHEARPPSSSDDEPGTAAAPASVRECRLFSGDMCRNAMPLGS